MNMFLAQALSISQILVVVLSNGIYFNIVPDDIYIRLEKTEIIKAILTKYFKSERSVTVLWLKEEYLEMLTHIISDTDLESLFMHYDDIEYVFHSKIQFCFRFFLLFSSLLRSLVKRFSNPMMEYSTTEGYLVYADHDVLQYNILGLIKKLNPRAEVAIFYKSNDSNDAFSILKYAWKEYQLAQIIFIRLPFKNGMKVIFSLNRNSSAKKLFE